MTSISKLYLHSLKHKIGSNGIVSSSTVVGNYHRIGWCISPHIATNGKLFSTTSTTITSSSTTDSDGSDNNGNNNKMVPTRTEGDIGGGRTRHPQPFVQAVLQPMEWDDKYENPLYRPKFKNKARVISADDFNRRAPASLSGVYEKIADSSTILTWQDQNEMDQIYALYAELIESAGQKFQRTSHEYVTRVLSQKFNVSAERVAAVIELKHNEQQLLKEGHELCEDLAAYMDYALKYEIEQTYKAHKEEPPDGYSEDVDVGIKKPYHFLNVEDMFDTDQMTEDLMIREDARARFIIDNHIYLEDVDIETVPTKIDSDCVKLMKQRDKLTQEFQEKVRERSKRTGVDQELLQQLKIRTSHESRIRHKRGIKPKSTTTSADGYEIITKENPIIMDAPEGTLVPDPPRWNYAAQIINTRRLKRSKARYRGFHNKNTDNTVIEYHRTKLRPANMMDIQSVSWKTKKSLLEHSYKGAKTAWLNRFVRNDVNAWGPASKELRDASKAKATGMKFDPKKEVDENGNRYNDDDDIKEGDEYYTEEEDNNEEEGGEEVEEAEEVPPDIEEDEER